MSMPNIPDIAPKIELDIDDSAKLLLNSIALEEMGLSHIVNAEGEKLQYVLGRLERNKDRANTECEDRLLLKVNKSIKNTLREVLKNQMILQMKLEDTIGLYGEGNFGEDCYNCNPTTNCDNGDIELEDCEDDDGEGINCPPIYF